MFISMGWFQRQKLACRVLRGDPYVSRSSRSTAMILCSHRGLSTSGGSVRLDGLVVHGHRCRDHVGPNAHPDLAGRAAVPLGVPRHSVSRI